jgi:hypothetical protein
MPNLVIRYFNRIHIMVHNRNVPTDDEWNANVLLTQEIGSSGKGALCLVPGGRPYKKSARPGERTGQGFYHHAASGIYV